MVSRDQLRQLADFECRRPDEFAVTFYFQPGTPKDKSHREEAIQAKDLVRKTIQDLQLHNSHRGVLKDLHRILEIAEHLHGNQARSKVVFACCGRELWREFDVPPVFPATRLFVNRRFYLKPLAALFSEYPKLWVALADQKSARVLEIEFGHAREQAALKNALPRHGHSDGFAGYDGGHAQRHQEDEVRRHFQRLADLLQNAAEHKQFDALVFGCNDVNWPDLEAQLHPDVKKRVLGRFTGELNTLTNEQAAEEALRIARSSLHAHHLSLLDETLGEARSNGRGVTGLRRVLRSVELGEVDTILMAEQYSARAVECTNCNHLDSHIVPYCPVCGRATRQLDDVCEALVPMAVKNNLGLVLLREDSQLNQVGNIAALLRFRADRNVNKLRAAS